MSWVRPIMAIALGTSALFAGLGFSTAASAAIVVSSSGPSAAQFPPGKKLDDASRITLQKGDSVTVLDQRGTKVLRGPGRLAVSQPGRPLPNPAYAVLTRKDAASRARTGAVRTGEDAKPVSPNLWYVDLTKPGTQCVVSPEAVKVWRPDPKKAARYRIGGGGTVSFPAEATVADWAGAVTDGASYTLAPEGAAAIGSFKFVVMASPPSEAEGLALALIEKGCTTQLDLLSKTLSMSRF